MKMKRNDQNLIQQKNSLRKYNSIRSNINAKNKRCKKKKS